MFDDITKALTIQISADDLTGGAWSSIGKGAKDLMNLATPLNQAWELGTKVFETFAGAVQKPIEMLSEGGALAETEAAFRGLSDSFKVDGDSVVDSLKEISSNTLGVEKAMQSASDAIRMGFSEQQIDIVAKFAKKYTEAVGGDFTQVAGQIFEAISTGKNRALKDFGIVAEKGDEVSSVLSQIVEKTEKYGKGAYNFGDDWQAVLTNFADGFKQVYKEVNNLFGETGMASMVVGLRNSLAELADEAPTIATGIFVPFKDAMEIAWAPIGAVFEAVGDFFGMVFGDTDSLGIKINTVLTTIGTTFYDTAIFGAESLNFLLTPLNEITKIIFSMNEGLLKVQIAVAEWQGVDESAIGRLRQYLSESEALSKTGMFTIDTNDLVNKREAFVDSMMKAGESVKDLTKTHKDHSDGLKLVGQAFLDADDKQKKVKKTSDDHRQTTKLLVEDTKALSDAYSKMGDNLGNTVKTIGDVLNVTQTGINEVASIGAKAMAESDPFKFGEADKQRGIQTYLDKLRSDKAKEQEILKEQAAAQRELAKSMDRFATTPRKVEHNVSGNDPLGQLALSIIKTLNDMALVEGTEVLGR